MPLTSARGQGSSWRTGRGRKEERKREHRMGGTQMSEWQPPSCTVTDAEYADFLFCHVRTEGLDSWAGQALADLYRSLAHERDEHLSEAEEIMERILWHRDGLMLERVVSDLATITETLDKLVQPKCASVESPGYFSMSEAAAKTGLSYSTIRRAVMSLELPVSKIGSGGRPTYRISDKDLAEWLEKAKGGVAPPPSMPTVNVRNRSRHFDLD